MNEFLTQYGLLVGVLSPALFVLAALAVDAIFAFLDWRHEQQWRRNRARASALRIVTKL